jgi:two-component system LytT family response regulator
MLVDDEQHCRESLKHLLGEHCPELEVIKECSSVESAVKALFDIPIDVLFLDVMMSDGTGFDVLERTRNIPFRTIFTTAHDEFAIRAIRFAAIDYLLKPICADDLINAAARIPRIPDAAEIRSDQIKTLSGHIHPLQASPDMMALPTQDGLTFIEVRTIIRCEAKSNYTELSATEGEQITVCRTLKEFEDLLQPYDFIRIHHSHIINLHHLRSYVKGKGGYVIMSDGGEIEVSVRKKEEFLQRLQNITI